MKNDFYKKNFYIKAIARTLKEFNLYHNIRKYEYMTELHHKITNSEEFIFPHMLLHFTRFWYYFDINNKERDKILDFYFKLIIHQYIDDVIFAYNEIEKHNKLEKNEVFRAVYDYKLYQFLYKKIGSKSELILVHLMNKCYQIDFKKKIYMN